MSIQNTLTRLFSRDLQKLSSEIQSYKNPSNIWLTDGQITNSSGNLALHICGNLQHFIGNVLGETGYQRKREAEFVSKNMNTQELIKQILETESIIVDVISELSEARLGESYPINVAGNSWRIDGLLIHLHSHLNYHLGQVNYHRRLVEK
jgi:uncharacterized damage-inducible protein DinB